MKKKKNKHKSWSYTTSNKEARIKVKRLRNKAERRIHKYEMYEEYDDLEQY